MNRQKILSVMIPVGIIAFIMIFLRITNVLPVFYGFAIDAHGNLYIGQEERIVVLNGKTIVKTIQIPLHSGNSFSIIDGNTIGIQKEDQVFFYNLNGEPLWTKYQKESIRPYRNIFEDSNGKKYVLKSTLGYRQIFQETEEGRKQVYATSVWEYLGYILLYCSVFVTVILVFIFVLSCLLDPNVETQYDWFAKRTPSYSSKDSK